MNFCRCSISLTKEFCPAKFLSSPLIQPNFNSSFSLRKSMSINNYLQRIAEIAQRGSLAALVSLSSLSSLGTLGCEKDAPLAYQPGFFASCQSTSCCEQVDECLEEQLGSGTELEGEAGSPSIEDAAAGCTVESWECHDTVMERCYQHSTNGSSYPSCVDVDVRVMNAAELKHKNKYFDTDILFKLFRQYGSSKELIDQSYSGEFREVFARPGMSGKSAGQRTSAPDQEISPNQPTQFRAGLFKTMRTPLFWQDHQGECRERKVNPEYGFMLKDGSCQVKQFGSVEDCDPRSYIQCEFFYDSTSSQPLQPEKRQYEWSMDVGVELWKRVGEKIFCDDVPTSSKPICFPPFGL